jgi:hypothetical protein
MRHDARDAEVLIFTYAEGLLAGVAHDLKLKVTEFTIEVDEAGGAVLATLEPSSVRVVCAMVHGLEDGAALSSHDLREIEHHIALEVLQPAHHGELRFEGFLAEPGLLHGTLTLHGQMGELEVPVRREESHWIAEFRLDQRAWGIRPYRAMLGALKVKAEVLVRVTVPTT